MSESSPDDALTLITTSFPPSSTHLPATAASIIEAQARFPGYLHWHLMIDGPGEVPRFRIPPNTVIRRSATHIGLPAARNLVLARVETGWVMPLDHDDLLDADGLSAIWSALTTTDSPWVAGNVELVHGGPSPHYSTLPKSFPPGFLETNWCMPFVFYPNAVIVRTVVALAVGGWPALPVCNDLAFCFALNHRYEGKFLPHTIMRYRRWISQMTQLPIHPRLKADEFAALGAAINARRKLDGLPPIRVPDVAASFTSGSAPSYWQADNDDQNR